MLRRATVGTLPLGMFLALLVAAILSVGLLVVLVSYNNPALAQSITAVPGTTITVNTQEDETTDDGNCSLREAIEAADTNLAVDACAAGSAAERDAIHFSLGRKATIELGSTLPAITDPSGLNINGQRAKITISGKDAVRVFQVESGAKLTLARLTVAHGSVPDDQNGGGLANFGGVVKVNNSTFSGNRAGDVFGGGGGIVNRGGTLTVTNSTLAENRSPFGSAIYNFAGPLTVTNSTFSGNSAVQFGDGSTIFNDAATATLKNTILANNPLGVNCAGNPVTDGGYNIDDGTSCGFSAANNSLPSTNPLLDPNGLQNNGGPTKTIKLLKGSPAINAIPKAENGCGTEITTDQRGVKRPQGSGCDIGAFEKKRR